MEAFSQNDSLQAANAFSQNDSNPLGSTLRHSSNHGPFRKVQIA
jgi:hypothetical protein